MITNGTANNKPNGVKGKQMEKKIRLMKHYVTDGTTKARCSYSHFKALSSGLFCVTIYEKDYARNLHKIFSDAENNSDGMTDYFENSHIRIYENNPLYEAALSRCRI